MYLIRLLLQLRTVYLRQTGGQILFYFYIVFLLTFVAWLYARDYSALLSQYFAMSIIWDMFCFIVALECYILVRSIVRTKLVTRYMRQFPAVDVSKWPPELRKSSISLEQNKVDHLHVIDDSGAAKLFVAVFDHFRRDKGGPTLTRQVYYKVLQIKLERKLPHVLFDAKATKGRQFKYLYLKAQRISVQGGFDDLFDTYVPQTYHIDSLSFVTPEVMEALVEASGYDIEIINDKLYLYAPLLGPDGQSELIAKGEEIAKRLNDNIDTYRDDRLSGTERKTDVSTFGRALLKSPLKYILTAIGAGVGLLVIIALAFLYESGDRLGEILFNEFNFVILAILGGNIYEANRIIRNNRRAIEANYYLHQTDRGKPIQAPSDSEE